MVVPSLPVLIPMLDDPFASLPNNQLLRPPALHRLGVLPPRTGGGMCDDRARLRLSGARTLPTLVVGGRCFVRRH